MNWGQSALNGILAECQQRGKAVGQHVHKPGNRARTPENALRTLRIALRTPTAMPCATSARQRSDGASLPCQRPPKAQIAGTCKM
jgi:hypothetical protein